jgi:hypothetical protein
MRMAQCLLVCECECECEWREEAKSNSKPDQPPNVRWGDDELMSMSTRLSSSDDPTGSGFSSPISAPGLLPRESHAAASCDGASASAGPFPDRLGLKSLSFKLTTTLTLSKRQT